MKIIEVIADSGHTDTITGIAEQQEIRDFWLGQKNPDGRLAIRLLVNEEKVQTVLDALQTAMGASENIPFTSRGVIAKTPG
jgi:hypothetical protein